MDPGSDCGSDSGLFPPCRCSSYLGKISLWLMAIVPEATLTSYPLSVTVQNKSVEKYINGLKMWNPSTLLGDTEKLHNRNFCQGIGRVRVETLQEPYLFPWPKCPQQGLAPCCRSPYWTSWKLPLLPKRESPCSCWYPITPSFWAEMLGTCWMNPPDLLYVWFHVRRWHPTPVFLPRKSHGWRNLVGCSPWGL